jgi:flavin-binding protein dodecin
MNPVFEYSEFVGTSTKSIEEAIRFALDAAAASKKINWFEVGPIRGRIMEKTGEPEYQVTIKVGSKI